MAPSIPSEARPGFAAMKSTEEQQSAEEKAWEDLPSKRTRKRRWICCGGAVAIALLIIGIVALVLALVVFRIRDPRLGINLLKIRSVDFKYDTVRREIYLNATLELLISVRNPNKASFKFRNGTTLVYRGGTKVGRGVIPAGKIPADRTVNLTSIVTIAGAGLAPNSYLLNTLNFSTSTIMSGRVSVLNIYKHHAVSSTFCNLTVSVSEQRIEGQQCIYSIKL